MGSIDQVEYHHLLAIDTPVFLDRRRYPSLHQRISVGEANQISVPGYSTVLHRTNNLATGYAPPGVLEEPREVVRHIGGSAALDLVQ
jgi:hypothetical protein